MSKRIKPRNRIARDLYRRRGGPHGPTHKAKRRADKVRLGRAPESFAQSIAVARAQGLETDANAG